jgi:hypothetical protein
LGLRSSSLDGARWSGLFLIGRLVLLLALPLEGLRGYGDVPNYLQLAKLGIPFLDYWVEFPPIFPFLNAMLDRLAGGKEHVYLAMFYILMSLCQAGSLYLFTRLVHMVDPQHARQGCILAYFTILLVLPYGWWYFDPLVVLFMMLGIYLLAKGRDGWAGVGIAIGVLSKFFPALLLPVIWKLRTARRAAWISLLVVGSVIMVYAVLYLVSPQMTAASLAAQASKGSWETPWALIDGNFQTGNFGAYSERYDPAKAYLAIKHPARIPAWLTLVIFAGLGGWVWWKVRLQNSKDLVAFLGFTWCLFLLWSPGWSPQWTLYLLPLFLLALPQKEALLLAAGFVLVNLMEWPVLLSRGYVMGLWLSIPLRTLLLALAAYLFWTGFRAAKPHLELEKEVV